MPPSAAQRVYDDMRRRKFYSRFIAKGDLTFDIGANLGNRTRIFARLGAIVIAVEPQDHCMKTLQKEFGGNRRVQLIKKALGPSEGSAEIMIYDASGISSISSRWVRAVQESGRFSQFTWPDKQSVQVTTLDKLIEEFGVPSFIKIDVEGYELGRL